MFLELTLAVLSALHGAGACAFLFLLLAVGGTGAPWSQDLVVLAAGALTLQGGLSLVPTAVVAWLALLAGDALSLWFGHHYGARWVRRPWAAKFVPPGRLPSLEEGMRRHGALLAFVTRFLPGQRGTLYFIAGTLRLPWRSFLLADGFAALLQVPLYLWGVRALGWRWESLRDPFERADDLLTLALVVVLLAWWLRARRASRAA